ncbi:MAG: dTMP kinase [Fimbriimonadaceae bacterium]|nr:dTMP kinase [Fimbriimonadaceae bacterium]
MFISFEGPEGAGKTTAIRALADRLVAEGHAVRVTKEPGEGETGRRIREILLHGDALEPYAELFLFLADRTEHVQKFIRPWLTAGDVVLCDRYADSTLVYQVHGRGLDREFVEAANARAVDGLWPDRTILLDLPPDVGLARLQERDRIDAAPIEFHRRVRDGFLELAQREPRRFAIVNADGPPGMVHSAIWEVVADHFARAERNAIE